MSRASGQSLDILHEIGALPKVARVVWLIGAQWDLSSFKTILRDCRVTAYHVPSASADANFVFPVPISQLAGF
jgi:hypothetical protein